MRNKKKWNIGWGVISKCNMECKFCYSKENRMKSNDLKYSDWIKFIDENHQNINSINYGTGENTIEDDWFKLINYVKNEYPHIEQSLTTNGYLSEAINRSTEYNKIIKNSIDEVDVSLDFADEEKHCELRGQSNAYKWAIETLDYCQKNNIQSTIVFLGSKVNLNKQNIDGLFKIAKKYSTLLRMNIFRPTEANNKKNKDFVADFETIINALYYINSKYKILAISDVFFSSILTNSFDDDPSGNMSLRILSDGSITPSTYLLDKKYIVGNIKDECSLRKIDFSKIIYKEIPNDCNGCKYIEKCAGGVYDRRYLWFNSLRKKDPYCSKCFIQNEDELEKIKIIKSNFKSIHYGYLPTMFFKN